MTVLRANDAGVLETVELDITTDMQPVYLMDMVYMDDEA